MGYQQPANYTTILLNAHEYLPVIALTFKCICHVIINNDDDRGSKLGPISTVNHYRSDVSLLLCQYT